MGGRINLNSYTLTLLFRSILGHHGVSCFQVAHVKKNFSTDNAYG